MTTPPARSGEGSLTQVSLSALEHYAYCPRQCGLILLEDFLTDDAATVRGTLSTSTSTLLATAAAATCALSTRFLSGTTGTG
ncbi:hypothetical protein SCALM49S_05058 [Streptomyces californicus]